MRTLSQHLVMKYTYEQAMGLGCSAFENGLTLNDNPFMDYGRVLTDIRFSSLIQAWETGFKIQQKAK